MALLEPAASVLCLAVLETNQETAARKNKSTSQHLGCVFAKSYFQQAMPKVNADRDDSEARPAQLRQRTRTPPSRGTEPRVHRPQDQRLSTTADARVEPLHVVLGRRILVGRSADLLQKLQETRLFNLFDDDLDHCSVSAIRRGTAVQRNGKKCFVLDTFLRYRVPTADVAELTQHGQTEFYMGTVSSVPMRELSNPQAARVELAADRTVKVYTSPRRRLESAQDSAALDLMAGVLQHLQADLRQTQQQQGSAPAVRKVVFPQAAKDHQEFARANGEAHTIIQTDRNCQPCFVLDMPFPLEFIAPSWRCSTCHHKGQMFFSLASSLCLLHGFVATPHKVQVEFTWAHQLTPHACLGAIADRVPLQRLQGWPQHALQQYFQVTDDDIRQSFPSCMVHREDHQRPCYFTNAWFFQLARFFYETFNARAARRGMANWYSAATLHGSTHLHFSGTAPYSLAWQVSALPKNAVIRGVLLRGLASVVAQQVARMRRRQILYNSKGIRVDGNFKMAKRLLVQQDEDACTVLLGFCGTDGSLLDLLHPLPGEWWGLISAVLKPLLQDIQDTFVHAGYTAQEARPVLLNCNK